MFKFEKLEVWQKAIEFSLEIHNKKILKITMDHRLWTIDHISAGRCTATKAKVVMAGRLNILKRLIYQKKTMRFYQEIYDEKGKLIEVHKKYPIDKGHYEIKGDKINEGYN